MSLKSGYWFWLFLHIRATVTAVCNIPLNGDIIFLRLTNEADHILDFIEEGRETWDLWAVPCNFSCHKNATIRNIANSFEGKQT